MARTARPSDIYGKPQHNPHVARPAAPSGPPPPRGRRVPAWLWVAVALAVALVVSGLIGGRGPGPPPVADAPLVDIVSEDQAVAALALYAAEADTIDQLSERQKIYEGGGPPAAAGVARRGAASVQSALEKARAVPGGDPLYTDYVGNGGHVVAQQSLTTAGAIAETIALLSAAHESIYSGTGEIGIDEAYQAISAAVSSGRTPGALNFWGVALLEEIENRPRHQEAAQARVQSAEYWANFVAHMEPAATPELTTYINGLPAVTVEGLRGHPVAGPALQRLEEGSRQVSTGTTSPWGRR